MSRLLSLLALLLVLSACDAGGDAATARLSVGETYHATTLRFTDEASGLGFDLVQFGAAFDITFDDATQFTAHVAFPEAFGTDDGGGALDETVTGTYVQTDDAVTFHVASEGEDTFLEDEGWTVQRDGRSLRFSETEDGARVDLVLTRR